MSRSLPALRSHARGLGLVSAVFLIVVVSILAAAITRTVRTSGDLFARDVLAHRALLAAESGAQLALNRVFAPAGAGSCGNWTWPLDDVGLPRCQVSVACRGEVVAARTYYTLDSAGRCDAGGEVAERQIVVRAQP